jgi:hypothetical protein
VNPVIHMRRSGPRSGPRRARPYAISRGSTLCPGVKPQRRHAPKCGPAVRPVEQPGPG